MKKPHIAMILPDRIEHPVGGMGVQAKYLIQHLEKDFDFGVHGFPDETSLPYYHGVPNLMSKIQHGALNTLASQAAYLASICAWAEKGVRPDIIHVADYTEYLGGYYASKIFNVPLVVSMQLSSLLMHEANLFNAREPKSPDGMAIENIFKEMELFGLHKAAHIIHVSNMYKEIFSKIPGLDQKSTYIPNGVELEEWLPTNPGFKEITLPGNNKRKVVYLGRFASQKNIGALIKADIPKNIDLIFVGDKNSGSTEVFQSLLRKAAQAPNIHYIGPAYDQEKVNILSAADAVIIPSLHECHPIIMHEAMAAHSVVLHSGAGDMREILTEDFALYCGISPKSIELALQKFADMTDEEMARRKNAGFNVVQNYTWKLAAEKTKKVYDDLLS